MSSDKVYELLISMIDNDSCIDNAERNNALRKLFYEFVHGRPLDELLFPKFLGCEI